MNRYRSLWRALAFCPLLLIAPGCQTTSQTSSQTSSASQTSNAPETLFPRDNLGREVALKAPAKRVIAIGPGALETAFALGAGSQIVGRDSAGDFPSQAKKIAVAGDYRGPNLESSLALRPDLVIVQGEGQSKAQLDEWQTKLGVPVAALGATTLAGAANEIERLGAWLGQKNRAAQLQKRLQIGSPKLASRPRVFIQIGSSPLWSAGKNTLVGDVVEKSGFENIALIRGYQAYNLETLSAQKVDFYLVPTRKSRAQTLAELRKTPALAALAPIQNGKVLVIDPDLVFRPGPRLADGVARLRSQNPRLVQK